MAKNPLFVDLAAHLDPLAPWSKYRDDPVRFFLEVLGIEPWARQREVLEAIVHSSKVAVRSGHKVGKSLSAAGLALWWVCTRLRARVVMTSASYRQVKAILWRELRALHTNARIPTGGELHTDPDTGLLMPDGREIVGFSTDSPERMSGISGATPVAGSSQPSSTDACTRMASQ
jgi:phage terminase large subunit